MGHATRYLLEDIHVVHPRVWRGHGGAPLTGKCPRALLCSHVKHAKESTWDRDELAVEQR